MGWQWGQGGGGCRDALASGRKHVAPQKGRPATPGLQHTQMFLGGMPPTAMTPGQGVPNGGVNQYSSITPGAVPS